MSDAARDLLTSPKWEFATLEKRIFLLDAFMTGLTTTLEQQIAQQDATIKRLREDIERIKGLC